MQYSELEFINILQTFFNTLNRNNYSVKMLSFHVFAVKSRTAQQAKMKWVVNIVFYILQVNYIKKKQQK